METITQIIINRLTLIRDSQEDLLVELDFIYDFLFYIGLENEEIDEIMIECCKNVPEVLEAMFVSVKDFI